MASISGVQTIAQKLLLLQPKPIDPLKCDPNKSLYWQIIKNNQTVSKRQAKQFNLGNTQTFTDPIKAAMFLLQREYGESSLFKNDLHEAVFIPPTFVSQQYKKKSTVAILDYDVKKDLERLLVNLKKDSPGHWMTMEFEHFMQTQNGADRIDKNAFDKWIVNLKIMYLVIDEFKTDNNILPTTTSDLGVFVLRCIKKLPSTSPEPELKTFLRECLFEKNFKKLLKQKIEENKTQDSNLRWLFDLELSELGEHVEHSFYDQLLPLKNDILQDTVVLSSVNFLTNVRNKMHKEADFLIISWQRKLIISVEMKSELKKDRVFEQLDSNHQLFEERLGDQLETGWTFFPAVCVGNSSISITTQHFVTMETDVKLWLESIFDNYPIVQIAQKPTSLDQVQKLLKIIVFSIHVSKKDLVAPITSSNWVEYIRNAIENVSTSDNILFYSNQQMAALNSNDPRYNKLFICGPFGTGKTILLRHKAIQINEKPQFKGKVMYLTGDEYLRGTLNSMLYHRMKVELEEKHGIFVMQQSYHFGDDVDDEEEMIKERERILHKITQHGIKAVFCDEFVFWNNNDLIKKMMEMVDFLWIVPATEALSLSDFKRWEDEFTILDLSKNFRNSREIVKSIKSFAEEKDYVYKEGIVMPPENFPTGCPPIFVDTFREAMEEARKRTKNGILVIGTFNIDDVIYLNQMNEKWKRYYSENTNDFKENENPYKFLQEGNVLIVISGFTYGFEWETVIANELVSGSYATYHKCNFMMRCTSNLIVVEEKSSKE
uniref:Chromosomal replication initiator protein DnaA ATPAse domain-containing protein n=1 Tax=Clytia hemisphaerica TaxID=252671 RepID=A0A7M5V782_9CNID